MKHFTIYSANGQPGEVIPEFIQVDGREVPLSERYHADFIEKLAPYDPSNPPPAPELPAQAVPSQVTMRQARLALLGAGKLTAVSAAIASLPSPQKETAQIEWEYAATVERQSPFVQLMAVGLQLDEAALDELFAQAASL